jgi:tetraprenyl-beta-curcumene synthase
VPAPQAQDSAEIFCSWNIPIVEERRRFEERRSAWAGAGEFGSLLGMGAAYWLSVQPQVQRELAVWDRLAKAIPDDSLRAQALAKLNGERLNPEAAALFAALAPRPERRRVVSLIVAYQVLYDYLDGVNESAGFDSLLDGISLHTALADALIPDRRCHDYYLNHPGIDDGGYMLTLCGHCRRLSGMIPSIGLSTEVLQKATERCGRAQSHNHADGDGDHAGLICWSREQQPRCPGYEWWEIAAGGISCLDIHAVVACAADRRLDPRDAELVEAAYFPSICSLSALLDSLADFHIDADSGNHSFAAHYRDGDHAAERIGAILDEAQVCTAALPNPRHKVVLAGIVAYYISSTSVWEGFPAVAAERLLSQIGPLGSSMCAVMRLRRRAHSRALPLPARSGLSPVSAGLRAAEPARRAVLAPQAGRASFR